MSNILLSNRSAEWYTPIDIMQKVHKVLGQIDLDPASCYQANEVIKAKKFLTKEDSGLDLSNWRHDTPVSVFLNPPSGRNNAALFWENLLAFREMGDLTHGIYLAYSIEQLATLQDCSLSLLDFPTCILRKRIKFVAPNGCKARPTHSNAIVYVSGRTNESYQFAKIFSDVGRLIEPYF